MDTLPSPSGTINGNGVQTDTALQPSQLLQVKEEDKEVIISPRTGRPKRRKASRACVHCQRTHLTCDNDRPCERCVQRGLAETCADGTRKKAKYLEDEEGGGGEGASINLKGNKKGSTGLQKRKQIEQKQVPPKLRQQQNILQPEQLQSIPEESSMQPDVIPLQQPQDQPSLSGVQSQNFNYAPLGNFLPTPGSVYAAPPLQSQPLLEVQDQSQNQAAVMPSDISPMAEYSGPKNRHNFQSSAINHEYAILSNILNSSRNGSVPEIGTASSHSPAISEESFQFDSNGHISNPHTNASLNQYIVGDSGNNLYDILHQNESDSSPSNSNSSLFTNNRGPGNRLNSGPQQPAEWLEEGTLKRPISFAINDNNYKHLDNYDYYNYGNGNVYQPQPQPQPQPQLQVRDQDQRLLQYGNSQDQQDVQQQDIPQGQAQQPETYALSTSSSSVSLSDGQTTWRKFKEPRDIYTSIRRPFSYTPGYHALIAYLRSRFNRGHLLKMAKCMARYRPSFIACTNSLKEEDLIFMEQCFQRTLMEYEKFISYSGTPTVVWRRTGQVTAVGKEFCILTGWTQERLLNQRTFIVELMDEKSVLEYFEMFSNIAFGDSRGAMMSECTLITPTGKKVRTSSMWTLKRDVFGIPMMIIGNFLPILA